MALGSRTLLNLGLLALVALLALLALYEPGKEKPVEEPALVALNSDGISSLRIVRANGETIVLERPQGTWRMSEPLAIGVNDYRISSLLRITELKSLGQFAAAPESLAQYGLDAPNATLVINGTTRLDFGNSTPIDQRRYVRIGDTIHLITDNYYYHLIGTPTTYASNSLLDNNSAPLRLDLPGLLLAQQEGKWSATPQPADFSVDQITQLIDHWRHAQALEVAPYDGRKGEMVRITLTGSDEPLVFLVTERTPELILARPDLKIQYHLPASSVAELLTLKPLPAAPDTGQETPAPQ
ncbi:MAG TPA: DUF4340 domain-containing protein [Gammaproteobacteria bacterium]